MAHKPVSPPEEIEADGFITVYPKLERIANKKEGAGRISAAVTPDTASGQNLPRPQINGRDNA